MLPRVFRALRIATLATLAHFSISGYAQSLHPLGAMPPTQQTPPRAFSSAAAAALPPNFDLTPWAVTAGDQGNVGSCVAWAIAHGMMGWLYNFGRAQNLLFAPMYMYSQINVGRPGVANPPFDGGAHVIDGMNLAFNQGNDLSSHYPQGDYDWSTPPTPSEIANAANFKVTGSSLLFAAYNGAGQAAITELKNAISNYQPVVITLPVRSGFDKLSPSNLLDDDTTSASRGWHAVLAVAYDQDGLLIQNSWGTGWGSSGFGRLSWNVVAQDVAEAWAVYLPPVPPEASIAVSAAAGEPGQSFTLTWGSANASACTIDEMVNNSGNWNSVPCANNAPSGSCSVAPTTLGSHLYRARCTQGNRTSVPATVNHQVAHNLKFLGILDLILQDD